MNMSDGITKLETGSIHPKKPKTHAEALTKIL